MQNLPWEVEFIAEDECCASEDPDKTEAIDDICHRTSNMKNVSSNVDDRGTSVELLRMVCAVLIETPILPN